MRRVEIPGWRVTGERLIPGRYYRTSYADEQVTVYDKPGETVLRFNGPVDEARTRARHCINFLGKSTARPVFWPDGRIRVLIAK